MTHLPKTEELLNAIEFAESARDEVILLTEKFRNRECSDTELAEAATVYEKARNYVLSLLKSLETEYEEKTAKPTLAEILEKLLVSERPCAETSTDYVFSFRSDSGREMFMSVSRRYDNNPTFGEWVINEVIYGE